MTISLADVFNKNITEFEDGDIYHNFIQISIFMRTVVVLPFQQYKKIHQPSYQIKLCNLNRMSLIIVPVCSVKSTQKNCIQKMCVHLYCIRFIRTQVLVGLMAVQIFWMKNCRMNLLLQTLHYSSFPKFSLFTWKFLIFGSLSWRKSLVFAKTLS